jgi:two-component system phosphate regulon sensor histidine kinase PhoR
VAQIAHKLIPATAVVLVAIAMAAVAGLLDPLWAMGLAVAVGLALAVAAWRHLRDAERILAWVHALAAEAEPPPPSVATAFGRSVAQTVRGIDRALRDRIRRVGFDAATASSVLDALHDPVVMLDADRGVSRGNAAARRLFGERMVGRNLAETLRQPEILDAVDAVLGGAPPQTVTLTLPVPVQRVYEVRIQRMAGPEAAEGAIDRAVVPAALVTFYDRTAIRRSEQMRADFVTNASPELKTPLASLIGFIETLRGPARDDAPARERFLAIMQEQSRRMSRLVADLMSLSRIELDEHVPPTAPVDVASVVRSVADALELKAAAQKKRIQLEIAPALPPVAGDIDQLHQVFQNLIDNAINYARSATEITVAVRPEADRKPGVVVTVTDRGEGIARHHLPRLTERFYRVDPARSRAVGGTGLGLAIVKHIVNRHRGRLEIDSEVGRGSTFSVHLPPADGTGEALGGTRAGWRAAS